MTILSEMRDFLDRRIKEHAGVDKERNIELICQYYGFGDLEFPTLEEVAQRFDSIGTRERVRQIIANNFRRVVTSDDIPSAQLFLNILVSRSYWLSSDLDDTLAQEGIAGDSFSLPSLLRLINDLKLEHSFVELSPDLQSASRSTFRGATEYYLARKQDVSHLRTLMQRAKTFPGLKGTARFEDLVSTDDSFVEHRELILQIIRRDPGSWVMEREDGFWYLFEDRDNTLINLARKALTAYETCDLSRLAQSADGALRRRQNRFVRPPVDLIEDYLRTSRHFAAQETTLRRSPTFKPFRLNEIEEDLLQFLRANREVRYRPAKDFLESRGHSSENIVFALTMSPLVYIDKTLGRRLYTYQTVEPLDVGRPEEPSPNQRYFTYRDRLHELRDTDSTSQQSARREQHILSQWLFEEKETERCALCGREFAVDALVAAHKKRRADCNEGERRDPHIAMPLCKFGCDYLYEQRHIFVENGTVERGVSFSSDGVEKAYVDKLVGRPLEDRWLEGRPDYFARPTE